MLDMTEFLQTGGVEVPWPTAVGDVVIPSNASMPRFCEMSCSSRDCLTAPGTTLGQRCFAGLTFYKTTIAGAGITVFGVVGAGGYAEVPNKIKMYAKDDLKGRTVRSQDFTEWVGRLKSTAAYIDEILKRTTSEALHPLHDTPKLAKQILLQSEAIINTKSGAAFDAKLGQCSEQEISLYKTAQLLVDSFDMLKIFFNPESARYGAMKRVAPYKLVDKLRLISLAGERASSRRKRITIVGNSHREYYLYDSFKIIPLTVMENAIKYSFENEISIFFDDMVDGTTVRVVSVGPLIDRDEYRSIFEKSKRGRNVVDRGDEGMGIGLFVASEAARANNVLLTVDSQSLGYEMYGVPVAKTSFSFVVKDVRRVT